MPVKSFLPIRKSFRELFGVITLVTVALSAGWLVRVNAQNDSEPLATAKAKTFDDRVRTHAIAACDLLPNDKGRER